MPTAPISFRPNETDRRILDASGHSATDAIRRGLRLLDHEHWLEQFKVDATEQRDFDPNQEPEAW
ncbi:MAG: hypothetical protein FWD59_02290 [Micrococcales bacterium]|nr:hypothetical protein [Micrococcales bacterium]